MLSFNGCWREGVISVILLLVIDTEDLVFAVTLWQLK